MEICNYPEYSTKIPDFESCIKNETVKLTSDALDVLQVNIGKLCNLNCKHCHVEAGPGRNEVMNKNVMEACLKLCHQYGFKTIDITGGAPEMNPDFEWFVEESKKVCGHVIVRTNLVIMMDKLYSHLPQFYTNHKVELVCSLPYYRPKDVNRQRGDNVFEDSIKVLKKLNELGYGRDPELILNIVYNPGGAFLPPDQNSIEKEYKSRLEAEYGISINRVLTITNSPIGRFAKFLIRSGNLEDYMLKLYKSFNPATLESMMCRKQLSVSWDGKLYDCDFNQAADLPIISAETITDCLNKPYGKRHIRFGNHCFACTAGQGSSCGGATGG